MGDETDLENLNELFKVTQIINLAEGCPHGSMVWGAWQGLPQAAP